MPPKVKITFKVDRKALRRVGKAAGRDSIVKAARVTEKRARRNLRRAGAYRTGNLLRNTRAGVVRSTTTGDAVYVEAATFYALWVENGRGPVHARPGGVLAFVPKGGSRVIFRTSVGPAKGIKFLRRALDDLTIDDFA